jgi:hypothetical protein
MRAQDAEKRGPAFARAAMRVRYAWIVQWLLAMCVRCKKPVPLCLERHCRQSGVAVADSSVWRLLLSLRMRGPSRAARAPEG